MKRLLLSLGLWSIGWGQPRPAEVALFEGGEGLEYFQQCARLVGSIHCYGDPRISESIRLRLLEGRPPEVSNANLPYQRLIEQGQILALDRWLDGPNWDGSRTWRQDFLPGSLDRFRRGGKTYAVPLAYTLWACYYNRALFRARGWQEPQSWEDWEALCQQIQATHLAPIAFQGRYSYYASPLLRHLYYYLAGPSAYQEQLDLKSGSFDNPAMQQTLAMTRRLTQYFQPGWAGMSHTEAQMEFLQGRAAMLICGSWFKSEMRGKIPADFQMAQFPLPRPRQSKGEEAVQVGAEYYFVFSHSAQPTRGVDYLRCLTHPDQATRLVQQQDLPVAIQGANAALSSDLAGLKGMLFRCRASFGEGLTPIPPGMAQLWSDVRYQLLHGQASPAQLAQELEAGSRKLQQPAATTIYPYRGWLLLGGAALLILLGPRTSGPAPGSGLSRLAGRDLVGLVLLPLLVYLGFWLLPGLLSLAGSLCRWDGLSQPAWAGLENFRQLLGCSPRFWTALGNNLLLMAGIPSLVSLSSLLYALLMRGRPAWQAFFFFPQLLGIGTLLIWQQLCHPQGPLNRILVQLGFSGFANFAWLGQDHLYWSLLPLALWSGGGLQLLLNGAALSQIPQELEEAAWLEGANPWQQFWLVTWPHLRASVLSGYLLLAIACLKSFETIWILTQQEPTSQVHTLGTLMMQIALVELDLGQASALACILLLLVLALQRQLQRGRQP